MSSSSHINRLGLCMSSRFMKMASKNFPLTSITKYDRAISSKTSKTFSLDLAPNKQDLSMISINACPMNGPLASSAVTDVKEVSDIHLTSSTEVPMTDSGAYARDGGTNGTHLYALKWHQQLGPIFRDRDLGCVFVSCPMLCEVLLSRHQDKFPRHFIPPPWQVHLQRHNRRRGIFFMDGEEWWETRQMLNPLLMKRASIRRFENMTESMTDKLLEQWSANQSLSVETALYRWQIEIMFKMMLGEVTLTVEDVDEFLVNVKAMFTATAQLMLVNSHDAANRNTLEWQQLDGALTTILDNIGQRLRQKLHESGESVPGNLLNDLNKLNVDVRQIDSILSDLVLGGVDTTAVTALWVLYHLATRPDIQASIRREVARVTNGESVRCHHLHNLPYTRGFVREVTRLYPVAPFLTRILNDPMTLGGYDLAPNTLVNVSIHCMARNNNYFHSPGSIQPERWRREAGQSPRERQLQSLSSLAFGHGIRSCIGRRLAEQQLHLLAAKIVTNYSLSTEDNHVEYITRMIGVPDRDVSIRLESLR